MARVNTTVIDLHDSNGEVPYPYINRADADPADVNYVLSKDSNDDEGRSQWQWFRLPNGDLILGVFPQGTTYFDIADSAGV